MLALHLATCHYYFTLLFIYITNRNCIIESLSHLEFLVPVSDDGMGSSCVQVSYSFKFHEKLIHSQSTRYERNFTLQCYTVPFLSLTASYDYFTLTFSFIDLRHCFTESLSHPNLRVSFSRDQIGSSC
jgi:hypothetical protein